MGHFGDASGYQGFINLRTDLTAGDHTLWQNAQLMAKIMLEDWGLAMCLGAALRGVVPWGAIPWAAIAGGAGYWLSLKFIRADRHEKAARRQRCEK